MKSHICPGKRLRQDLGQYTITSIETTPNMRVGAFVVGRLSQTAAILGIKSSGTFPIESPRKSLSCVDIIRTAMPFVNPRITGRGIYLIELPIFVIPIMTRKTPAITVATASAA